MQVDVQQQLKESLDFIRQHTDQQPIMGLILGSGLGYFADDLGHIDRIPTAEIPHFPKSTVEGHKGFLIFGSLEGIPVLAVQGRTHYYEGHSIDKVAYVVRIMAALGIGKLLVTNAAGGANRLFRPGDLMVIQDQINFLFANPLIGPVVAPEPRWPDLHDLYDPELIRIIEEAAVAQQIPLRKGVLFVSSGPSYETPAEVRMIQKLGGDAVSMSTIPEVLVARARGMKICGISCITNMGSGMTANPLSHAEVTEIAKQNRVKFRTLLEGAIPRIAKT